MKHYRQINKKTGIDYGVVNEAAKAAFESVPSTNVFRYLEIPPPPVATMPQGVKPAKLKPNRRKTKIITADDDHINAGADVKARRKTT